MRGRACCAGTDLSGPDPFGGDDDAARRRDSGGELALRLFASTKPLIAAINGAAVGVGVTMTLPMDIGLASERSGPRPTGSKLLQSRAGRLP